MSWDPNQYLKYADARLRPALDLLARIPVDTPQQIVDLGCGAGNVTRLLHERWPEAQLLGVDASAEMLARARQTLPAAHWCEARIETWQPAAAPDLIFSNAALHWVGGHDVVFPRLLAALAPGGTLALQMPANFAAPSHAAIQELADSPRWRAAVAGARLGAVLDPAAYFDLLAPLVRSLELWETTYWQVLAGDDPIVEWVKGTTLIPFLERLDAAAQNEFLSAYRARMATAYPRRADGTTLYPFKRQFLLAQV